MKRKEERKTELLNYAFSGVNIIPTILLLLVLLYWIVAILGALDLDFFDIDLESSDGAGPFYSLSVMMNIGKVPFGLVLSLLVLNFWILSMLVYLIPFKVEGSLSILVLLPTFIGGFFITKAEIIPLRMLFKNANMQTDKESKVLTKECRLLSDLEGQRLGQAEVMRDGANIVINVKVEFLKETFIKGDKAVVTSHDKEKNYYYIRKSKG